MNKLTIIMMRVFETKLEISKTLKASKTESYTKTVVILKELLNNYETKI